MTSAHPKPGKRLLTPMDHTLVLIDHQSQMAFATKSIDAIVLRNNAALVSKAAALFKVSTVLTTVAEKTFSGPIFSEIKSVFPDAPVIDRSTMNCWEDQNVTDAVNHIGKTRIVLAGLWTGGFEVCVIADACGDISNEAHAYAMERMIQAGAMPMTSLQYLLELQRDWARKETYNGVAEIAVANGGAYGLGMIYAGTMFGSHEG